MQPDRPSTAAPAITIRRIQPDEHAALGELTVAAYATGEDLGSEYTAELHDVATRASTCPVLVAVDEAGVLLGGIAYVPGPGNPMSELEHDGEAGIRMLAVDVGAQGRGVGRALAVACVDRARAEGRIGVALYTQPTNVAAQHLYESLGFTRDPSRDWEHEPREWLWAFQLAF